MQMIRKLYSVKQRIKEYAGKRRKGNNTPIYMVHHVLEEDIDGNNLSIGVGEFRDFITGLIKQGVKFIPPSELSSAGKYRKCLVTFDDMMEDAMLNAIPFLENIGIPYVCFLSPGLIGKDEYITFKDVDILRKSNLCTIGAHGINHKLSRILTEEEKRIEISRQKHEELLDCKIDDFAFPYGSVYACDNKSIAIAAEEYSRVYSTLNYSMTKEDRNCFLPRVNLNSNFYKQYRMWEKKRNEG